MLTLSLAACGSGDAATGPDESRSGRGGSSVTSVAVTPAAASVGVGETVQLTATAYDGRGRKTSGGGTSWKSTDTRAATVSSSGLVTGQASGSAQIIATIGGKADTSHVSVTAPGGGDPPPAARAGHYVSPTGSSGGTGSVDRPWDLASAIGGGKGVAPGDTIWVRGGTYRGEFTFKLDGSPSAQVVVRQYPGERATIDGNVIVFGSYTTLWGLEVMSSNPVATSRQGLNVKARGTKLVNLVVHDAGMSGIGFWVESPDSEVYGSLVYNNGTHENLDHGIYFQNQTGLKRIRDNIVFNNWAYGLHGYTSTAGYLYNIQLDGNVSFLNGLPGYGMAPDIFVGGDKPASSITATNNMTFRRADGENTAKFGYGSVTGNSGLTLTGNYLVGGLQILGWSNVANSGNTQLSSSAPPTSGTTVFVRPNAYEAGRANIVVYNWSKQGSVSADVSNVLRSGDAYEVRNVQNFYGAPVASGTYGGGTIQLPMSAVPLPTLLGRSPRKTATTGPEFQAFVLLRK
jgi:hypothetical protein